MMVSFAPVNVALLAPGAVFTMVIHTQTSKAQSEFLYFLPPGVVA